MAIFKRGVFMWATDPSKMRMSLGPQVMITLVIGLSFYQPGYNQTFANALFMVLLTGFMASMMMQIVVVPTERDIIKREYNNGTYSLGCYWVARCMQTWLSSLAVSVLTTPIAYFLIGLPNDVGRFFEVFVALWMLYVMAGNLAFIIGSVSPDAQSAVQRAPGPMVLLLLYAGLLIPKDDIKDWFIWVYHIDVFQYCYTVIMYAACKDQSDSEGSGNALLDHFSIKEDNLALSWCFMAGMILLQTFFGYYISKPKFVLK